MCSDFSFNCSETLGISKTDERDQPGYLRLIYSIIGSLSTHETPACICENSFFSLGTTNIL